MLPFCSRLQSGDITNNWCFLMSMLPSVLNSCRKQQLWIQIKNNFYSSFNWLPISYETYTFSFIEISLIQTAPNGRLGGLGCSCTWATILATWSSLKRSSLTWKKSSRSSRAMSTRPREGTNGETPICQTSTHQKPLFLGLSLVCTVYMGSWLQGENQWL